MSAIIDKGMSGISPVGWVESNAKPNNPSVNGTIALFNRASIHFAPITYV
jgi:hypothetical protein